VLVPYNVKAQPSNAICAHPSIADHFSERREALRTVGYCNETIFKAIAYKDGMLDSNVTTYDANYIQSGCTGGGPMGPMGPSATTIIFSVWDGDWAILEEYTTNNSLVEKYLQGYHGLVKTFVQNVYYYQDELGSTSHIADGTGALIESYQYDVYGKPRVYNPSGAYQPGATPLAKDLFTGQRWLVEIGLYDDRNRFMSPDLGRFLQPDPIGFKGDASNLYRYCGNDWANRTDPMGTTDDTGRNDHYAGEWGTKAPENAKELSSARSTFDTHEWKTTVWFRGNPFAEVADAPKSEAAKVKVGKETREARQVKDWFYDPKTQADYNKALISVMGPSALLVPPQNRKNAPYLDMTLNDKQLKALAVDVHKATLMKGDNAAEGWNNPGLRRNGTVYIAKNSGLPNRVFVHEFTNMLTKNLNRGDDTLFGHVPNKYHDDPDTGLQVELAMLGPRP
jgi:RHS repeat-associated protein